MCLKENKDNLRTIICKILVAKRNKPDWNESFILAFSLQRQTDQFHVADGTTTARWWAKACAISNEWWCHVRLKLPSPRKRLYLKFPTTCGRRRVGEHWQQWTGNRRFDFSPPLASRFGHVSHVFLKICVHLAWLIRRLLWRLTIERHKYSVLCKVPRDTTRAPNDGFLLNTLGKLFLGFPEYF